MAGAIVSASVGVLNPLLTKLSSLIEGEYKLLKSVKKDIIFLRNELSSISVLLEHLSNKEDKLDGPTMEWRNNMLELAYDIEDCIDLFIHKLSCGDANANFVRKIGSKIKKLWGKHQITECIQELKNRVMEEDQRRKRYQIDDFISEPSMVEIDPRLLALYEEVERLVGIDGPREKIVKWIMHKDWSSEQRKVVSIVGLGSNGDVSEDEQNLISHLRGFLKDKRIRRYLMVPLLLFDAVPWAFNLANIPLITSEYNTTCVSERFTDEWSCHGHQKDNDADGSSSMSDATAAEDAEDCSATSLMPKSKKERRERRNGRGSEAFSIPFSEQYINEHLPIEDLLVTVVGSTVSYPMRLMKSKD
ncbi:hypothetical protein OsI_19012 [Oryza sativa Indica Group]|uniref:Disease resistance N-terminal domain-containing protein n=1 Tax=Oryza sativa subsp. indica TaxID=39946 RepID=B8AZL6_ORYSI|nr:hypothetical protein OsI_19012 [Oryza sativa Indica Group]